MKYVKMLGLAALSAMALMAFAGSASAASLEVGGVADTDGVTISASLKSGTSAILKDTEGFSANTCTTSTVHGDADENLTTAPTGEIETLSFSNCTRTVTVHDAGALEVTSAGGTNGNVYSEGAQVTVGSPFGTLDCVTGTTTKIGTLTGTGDTSKHATMDINAVINCGFFIPTAKWEGTYTVTSPTGLGVSA